MAEINNIPLSLPVANPSLKDILDAWKNSVLLSTNCHGIATIQEIYPSPNGNGLLLAQASMNYVRSFYEKDTNGNYQLKTLNYPVMVDCPVVALTGGTTNLTMPVQPGDPCLVLFNDRDFSNWFVSQTVGQPVATARLHSFSDAIVLVGFQFLSKASATHALLTNGDAEVGVALTGSQVRIANDLVTLGKGLNDLTQALQTFLTGLNPSTLTGQAATALTAVTAAAAEIQSVLE